MSLLAVPIDSIAGVAQLDWAKFVSPSTYTRGTMTGNPVAEWITSPPSRKIVDLDFTLPALSAGQIASLSGVSLAMTLGSSVGGNSLAVMGERDLTPLVMASETAQKLYGVGGRWVTFDTIPIGTGPGVIARSLPVGSVLKEDLTYEARRLRLYLKMSGQGTATITRPEKYITIRPQPLVDAQDSWLDALNPTQVHANDDFLRLFEGGSYSARPVLYFNLSSLTGKTVFGAQLQFVFSEGSPGGSDDPVTIARVTKAYERNYVCWNRWKLLTNWDTPGGDYEMGGLAGYTPQTPPTVGTPLLLGEPAVLSLCQDAIANRGGVLRCILFGVVSRYYNVFSSNHATPAYRPTLKIWYLEAPTVSPITLTMSFATNAHIRSQNAVQLSEMYATIRRHQARISSRNAPQSGEAFVTATQHLARILSRGSAQHGSILASVESPPIPPIPPPPPEREPSWVLYPRSGRHRANRRNLL